MTSVIWRGEESEQKYALDVQTASRDVGSDETAELALFEVLQGLLARLLGNVAVENAGLSMRERASNDDAAKTLLAGQLVAGLLHVAENDGSAVHAAVDLNEIGDDLGAGFPGTAKHEMTHIDRGLFLLRDEIDGDFIGMHVFGHDLADPRGNRR